MARFIDPRGRMDVGVDQRVCAIIVCLSKSVVSPLTRFGTSNLISMENTAFRCRVSSIKFYQTFVVPFLPQETSRFYPDFRSSFDLHPTSLGPFLRRPSPLFLRFSPFLARRNLYEMSTFGSHALSPNVPNDGSRRIRYSVFDRRFTQFLEEYGYSEVWVLVGEV